jgi:NADH:ubiquinone reductase (H+-translocating)
MRTGKPQIIVVGGGFGGLYAARALAHLPVKLTVLDRKNHHTFQRNSQKAPTVAVKPLRLYGHIHA